MNLYKVSWGTMVIFNGLAYRELTDQELQTVMPVIVKSIGAIPHGECHIHHFQPYQAPPSGHQFIGYEGYYGSDGVSAVQYVIDSIKFGHALTAIQACDKSHFIVNYGEWEPIGLVSVSFDLFSCSDFDGQKVVREIVKAFCVREIYWGERIFRRPL